MAAPFVAFVLKNGGWALSFFTAKGTMSARRAQRECSYSEGVQEFGGSFPNMAAPFVAFVLKNGGWALSFFTAKGTMSARRAQRATSLFKPTSTT